MPGKIKICRFFFFFVGLVHHPNLLSCNTLSLRVEFLKSDDGCPRIPRGLPLIHPQAGKPGQVASGGALAPQPPHATRSPPEFIRTQKKNIQQKNIPPHSKIIELQATGHVISVCDGLFVFDVTGYFFSRFGRGSSHQSLTR